MRTKDAVADYINHCLEQGDTAGTITVKQSILNRFAAALPELPTDPRHIFKFLGTCGHTSATRKSARRTIRAFYTFICQKHDLPDPMPKVAIPMRAAKRSLTSAQVLHGGGGGQKRFSPVPPRPGHPLPPLGNTLAT